jgi:hypothetical protein
MPGLEVEDESPIKCPVRCHRVRTNDAVTLELVTAPVQLFPRWDGKWSDEEQDDLMEQLKQCRPIHGCI